ncbi:MAG: TrkH family potassium uptake protein [Lachnospiraceae bacterium]|nr:TrkH family potassium uptake protein [Lachnospiraceae bacterium]
MNYKMIRYVLSWVLRVEGVLMLLPAFIGLLYREEAGWAYLIMAAVCGAAGFLICLRQPKDREIYMKEGLVTVSLSWIVMSLFGALPFVLTREIPFYIDALFEIVSGFTTTGSSILTDVEALTHASLFWRSFSHWIGGMGVLVFILMLLPVKSGSMMNLMKAESPGPAVGKFVPRVRNTAKLLYRIYIALTLVEILCLLIAGMPVFDTICLSFGTAGTGGFGILNSSVASYTALQQWIITIFMILFGVNFSSYFLILCKKYKSALLSEEVRMYFLIILSAIALITWNICSQYAHIGDALRDAAFQVGSIITTTGYSTTDFNQWPELSKYILILLMFIGACAGSTGGGIKVSRILIMLKTIKKEMTSLIHPRSVKCIKFDKHPLEHEVLRSVNVFFITYMVLFVFSMLAISFDEFSLETNFTAVAATINNIGPGLDGVGPMSNFGAYSWFSKIILILDMLVGRLEIFPVIILLNPSTWRRKC